MSCGGRRNSFHFVAAPHRVCRALLSACDLCRQKCRRFCEELIETLLQSGVGYVLHRFERFTMSIATASSANTFDLQCGFAGTHFSLKVSRGIGPLVSISRSARGRMQCIQGTNLRTHSQRRANSGDVYHRFSLKYGLDTSRADFSTGSEADLVAGGREETFVERLTRAWSVLFPAKSKPSSNREIAKQRLKMILVSDRCSVNDEAKKKIVTNIVGALSDFVEIQSEEKVQFDVTSDAELNTVCSVTVPVRRVRPQYQEFSRELANAELESFDYEEAEGSFRMVDIRFERPGVDDIQD